MPAEKKYTNSFDLNYTLTYINPNSKTPLERTTLIVVSPELNPVTAGSFFGEIWRLKMAGQYTKKGPGRHHLHGKPKKK